MPESSDLPVQFWNHVAWVGECWVWTGSRTDDGYGTFSWLGRNVRAHRHAYKVLTGPVPDELALDHLCRNRLCVNPAHLEPVTSAENTKRGLTGAHHRIKTHCPKGHSYDEANTYRPPNGQRMCKECNRVAARQYRARLKEQGAPCPT